MSSKTSSASTIHMQSDECFITPCDDTGVPLAPEKTFKPSTVMIFLRYELDTS